MPSITYGEEVLSLEPGESVLDALIERGHEVPHSCRAGVCQSCLMQATSGTIPQAAQAGLKDTLQAQGYFLACRCQPVDDMAVQLPAREAVRAAATVTGREQLGEDVLRLRVQVHDPFTYRAGQYVTLWRDQTLGRSYSLASVPGLDEVLEFHIKLIPGGAFSSWAHRTLQPGAPLMLQGPVGQCFYTAGAQDQDLLLIGTGTGLAPLYGIARDALRAGHRGNIHLYHGALDPKGLYLSEALRALAETHANFHYHPSVLRTDDPLPADVATGPIDEQVFAHHPQLAGHRVYLCGDAALVNRLRKRVFLAGAGTADIYADAFLPSAQSTRAA